MIEPYGSAIERNLDKIASLGFRLTSNSDYAIVFSRDGHELRIVTEKYYHPSISMGLMLDSGRELELGLLEKIIDPNRFQRNSDVLKSFFEKHKLASTPYAKIADSQELGQYVSLVIGQKLDFLILWRNRVFDQPNSYKDEYDKLEKAFLSRFGVQ